MASLTLAAARGAVIQDARSISLSRLSRPCFSLRARRFGLALKNQRNFSSTRTDWSSSTLTSGNSNGFQDPITASSTSSSTLSNLTDSSPTLTLPLETSSSISSSSNLGAILNTLPETIRHPIDSLSHLLLAIPETVPFLSYGATIILLALIVRGGITLPVTLWQRARLRRLREIVAPEMKRFNDVAAGRVAKESRMKGWGYDAYRRELKRQMANYQSQLHAKHRTHPSLTLILPLAVHIPLLVLISMTIRHTLELPGSSMAAESFWWFDTLGQTDGKQILPILGGMLSFGNAELIGRRNRRIESDLNGGVEVAGEGDGPSPPDGDGQGRSAPTGTASSVPPLGGHGGATTQIRQFSSSSSSFRSQSTSSPNSNPSQNPNPNLNPSLAQNQTSKLPLTPAPPRRPSQPKSTRPTPPSPSPSPISSPNYRLRRKPSATTGGPPPETPAEHLTSMEPKPEISAEARKGELRGMLITTAMRAGAVLFVPIASQIPAGLVLYWVTSISFTLGQTFFLNLLDKRNEALKLAENIRQPSTDATS